MDLYGWVVFVHAATILLFFIAHGTSMAVAFALTREREPARVRALLDLSRFSLGAPAFVSVIIGVLTGIAAAFMGDLWGEAWVWISLVLFVVIGGLMTPFASLKLAPMRTAAGLARSGPNPPEDPVELARLLEAWNPLPLAAAGFGGFVVILWLMLAKPF